MQYSKFHLIKSKIIDFGLAVFRDKLPRAVSIRILDLLFFFKGVPVWLNYMLHNRDTFETELSIAACIKDECPYIKEWIEYHKLVGVEKFYLYDDNSSDNLEEILQPYIKNGEVVFLPFSKGWRQIHVYNDAVKRCRNKTKWLACIDIDEFIVPNIKKTITEVITEIETNILKEKITALAVHWVNYGYSGHYNKPEGLVTENYTKSDGMHDKGVYKSIANPRTVITCTGAHSFLYLFSKIAVNEKGTKIYNELMTQVIINDISEAGIEHIRINHYYTKSYEEYIRKCQRNLNGIQYKLKERYRLVDFDPDYLSHYDDMVMSKYVPILRNIFELS